MQRIGRKRDKKSEEKTDSQKGLILSQKKCKRFLTRRCGVFEPPLMRHVQKHARGNVFMNTIN
jgi:hypothetical protein